MQLSLLAHILGFPQHFICNKVTTLSYEPTNIVLDENLLRITDYYSIRLPLPLRRAGLPIETLGLRIHSQSLLKRLEDNNQFVITIEPHTPSTTGQFNETNKNFGIEHAMNHQSPIPLSILLDTDDNNPPLFLVECQICVQNNEEIPRENGK